jgi:hypothetical protein
MTEVVKTGFAAEVRGNLEEFRGIFGMTHRSLSLYRNYYSSLFIVDQILLLDVWICAGHLET